MYASCYSGDVSQAYLVIHRSFVADIMGAI